MDDSSTVLLDSAAVDAFGVTAYLSGPFDVSEFSTLAVVVQCTSSTGATNGSLARVVVDWLDDFGHSLANGGLQSLGPFDVDQFIYCSTNTNGAMVYPRTTLRTPTKAANVRITFTMIPSGGTPPGDTYSLRVYASTVLTPATLLHNHGDVDAAASTIGAATYPPLLYNRAAQVGNGVSNFLISYLPPVMSSIRLACGTSAAPANTLLFHVRAISIDADLGGNVHLNEIGQLYVPNNAGNDTNGSLALTVPFGTPLQVLADNHDTSPRTPNLMVWDTSGA